MTVAPSGVGLGGLDDRGLLGGLGTHTSMGSAPSCPFSTVTFSQSERPGDAGLGGVGSAAFSQMLSFALDKLGLRSDIRKIALDGAKEIFAALSIFHGCTPLVAIFGSARIREDSDPRRAATEEIGAQVYDLGFSVVTGGGPALMKAGNQGFMQRLTEKFRLLSQSLMRQVSAAIAITLPFEEKPNEFITEGRFVRLKYFFSRKVALVKYLQAVICAPGGMGTLDELFESLLVHSKSLRVGLMGASWNGEAINSPWPKLSQWLFQGEQSPLSLGFISPQLQDRLALVTSKQEVRELIVGRTPEEQQATATRKEKLSKRLASTTEGETSLDVEMAVNALSDKAKTLDSLLRQRPHSASAYVSVIGGLGGPGTITYSDLAKALGAELANSSVAVVTGEVCGLNRELAAGFLTARTQLSETAKQAAHLVELHATKLPDDRFIPYDPSPELHEGAISADATIKAHYLFSEKIARTMMTDGVIAMPGGIEVLDFVTEVQNLIMCRKMPTDFPVVLVGKDFWQPFFDQVIQAMIDAGTVYPEDVKNIVITDDVAQAREIVQQYARRHDRAHNPIEAAN